MKIAISATGESLDAVIDERFGRCGYFIILDTKDMSYEALENTNVSLTSSAGIQSAAFVASKGVEAVLTGNCGPKAMQVFSETNIQVILNQHGVIRDVVEAFRGGGLNPSTDGNVPEKSGIVANASTQASGQPGRGMGGGRGMGMGGGRGMGGGCGRGMGGGRGMGMGGRCGTSFGAKSTSISPQGNALTRDQEIDQLQQQSEQLKQQMDILQNRLQELT